MSIMMVTYTFRLPAGSREDKGEAEALAKKHGTEDVFSVRERHFAATDAYKRLKRVADSGKAKIRENTMPGNRDGERVIFAANLAQFRDVLEEIRHGYEEAAKEFLAALPEIAEEVKRKTAGRCVVSTNPKRYTIQLESGMMVLPQGAMLADMVREQVRKTESNAAAREAEAEERIREIERENALNVANLMAKAQAELAEKIREPMETLSNALAGEGRLCKATIDNLAKVLSMTGTLCDNAMLRVFAEESAARLKAMDVEAIRVTGSDARKETAEEVAKIRNALALIEEGGVL